MRKTRSGTRVISPTPPVPEPNGKPRTIASLAEFQTLCAKTLNVEFHLDSHPLAVEVRRLTPAEDAQLDAILNSVLPPIIRGKTFEEDRPDFNNVEYVKRKSQAEIEARALGLYWCVPIFQQERPGLMKQQEIVEFVQSKLNAQVLSMLWQAVRNGGVTLAELVNFT